MSVFSSALRGLRQVDVPAGTSTVQGHKRLPDSSHNLVGKSVVVAIHYLGGPKQAAKDLCMNDLVR